MDFKPNYTNVTYVSFFFLGEVNKDWYLGFPLRRTHDMGQRPFKQPNDRQQRGVVDECCRQPCSPSVLISYCRARK